MQSSGSEEANETLGVKNYLCIAVQGSSASEGSWAGDVLKLPHTSSAQLKCASSARSSQFLLMSMGIVRAGSSDPTVFLVGKTMASCYTRKRRGYIY